MRNTLIRILALSLLAAAFAGCSDDGGSDPTPTSSPTGTGTPTTSPSPTTGPEPGEEPQTRHLNVDLPQALSDCSLLATLISLDPATAAATTLLEGYIEVALEEQDWNGTYTVALNGTGATGAGAPAEFPLTGICVAFSTDDEFRAFSQEPSGTTPDQAVTLYIGGDFVYQGDVYIKLEPGPVSA